MFELFGTRNDKQTSKQYAGNDNRIDMALDSLHRHLGCA